jgi:CTP:phosphocholine cytidylyltransferase-like protein
MTTISIKRGGKNKKISVILLSDKKDPKIRNQMPLPLLDISKKIYLLDIQVAAIRASFSEDVEIILCCGEGADYVSSYCKGKYKSTNIRIVENKDYEETNNAESLRLCINNINNDSIMVCDGSLLLYPEALYINKRDNFLLLQDTESLNLDIGIVKNDKNIISNISYGLPIKWSEIFFLSGHENIEKVRQKTIGAESKKKLLFEILNESGVEFISQKNTMPLIKINSTKTQNHVRKMYENFNTGLFVRTFN